MIRFRSAAHTDLVWGKRKAFFCLPNSQAVRWIGSGELHEVLVGGKRIGTARVTGIKTNLLSEWDEEELLAGGFESTEELSNFLSRRYKTFNPEKQVVGIFFEMATLSSVF